MLAKSLSNIAGNFFLRHNKIKELFTNFYKRFIFFWSKIVCIESSCFSYVTLEDRSQSTAQNKEAVNKKNIVDICKEVCS